MANPALLRAAVVLFCSTCAFLMGLLFMRLLRKSIQEESEISSDPLPTLETLPVHLYNNVIQQLKQQKHELESHSLAEQQRTRTAETFSQAVLAHLPCGVLVFGTNGLIKTSNPAARKILGFASTTGMSADDIFRGAVIDHGQPADGSVFPDELPVDMTEGSVCLADEVAAALRGGPACEVEAEYETPAGELRFLAVNISPVSAENGNLLGATCLIADHTELECIRRGQRSFGERSGDMAFKLRDALAAISAQAQQLAENRDWERARRLANEIAGKARQLDDTLGTFLTGKHTAEAAAVTRTNS